MFEKSGSCGCRGCLCRECLFWWSGRCPHGGCFDDWRAANKPYDKSHPNDPPRKGWSKWKTDQAYWCRGGITYPTNLCCYYVEYKRHKVKQCLGANISVFQDGFISCSIIDSVGCRECYNRLKQKRHNNKALE